MNSIEKQLAEEKKRMDSIKAPEELEQTLKGALNSASPKRRTPFIWKVVVAATVLISVISYNYNALAYYSKKILGFDDMLFSNLKELNDNDMGQVIDKSIELENGTTLTINGMMTDENQLILFYTLSNPDGLDEDDSISLANITGFLTNSSPSSGSGYSNEDGTEVKWMHSFEPVNPFAKKLTLTIWQFTEDDEFMKEISFSHDPNKAMRADIKQPIKETLSVDQGEITIKSITASPTITVVDGTLNIENFDRFDHPFDGIKLIANGRPVPFKGSGSTSSLTGTKFDLRYGALPRELQSLKLEMREFTGYKEINKKISLASTGNEFVSLHDDEELLVKKITETTEGLEITIATDENVTLDGLSIKTKSGAVPLNTTIREDYSMQINARNMKERTLVFDTKEAAEHLFIEGVHYMKTYNKTIDIPIE